MDERLYPELTEEGAKEAQKVIDQFKDRIRKQMVSMIDEILGDFYVDVLPHIESDSWTNFRSSIISGMSAYSPNLGSYDRKRIREAIYRDHREEIIKDLNQDLIDEVESLKSQLDIARQHW
jgi:hypothetical protein